MDLSIIIVNYCTYDLTKKAIESIISKNHPFDYDIYVLDNASKDGSLEGLLKTFSKEKDDRLIKFINHTENKGFSYANNVAIRKTSAKYVLLLNSDTIIMDNCLEKCMNYMQSHNDIGALGCKVVLPDGTLDKACRRSFPDVNVSFYRLSGLSRLFPNSKRFGKYNLTYLDEDGTYEVDCLVGAFMFVRCETIRQVGLLDERFFMYGEDIDWCYRIKTAGWKIIYYGAAKIVHHKSASKGKKERFKLIYEFYKSMDIFYEKHYKNKHSWIVNSIISWSIWSIYRLKIFKTRLSG